MKYANPTGHNPEILLLKCVLQNWWLPRTIKLLDNEKATTWTLEYKRQARRRPFSNVQTACPVHHQLIHPDTSVQPQQVFYVHSSGTVYRLPQVRVYTELSHISVLHREWEGSLHKDSQISGLCTENRIWCSNIRCGGIVIYITGGNLRLESNFNTLSYYYYVTLSRNH